MPDLMSRSDAILLSLKGISLFEYGVSPNKLYGAYAVGRPVITTVNGSINDEVKEYSLGVTAPPDNPYLLAEAALTLMRKSRDERVLMGKRARALAETRYSRKKIISKYHELIKNYLIS